MRSAPIFDTGPRKHSIAYIHSKYARLMPVMRGCKYYCQASSTTIDIPNFHLETFLKLFIPYLVFDIFTPLEEQRLTFSKTIRKCTF